MMGIQGLRYQIMRNMSDVELQLQETITTVLGDYSEAQHIAWECLHQSKCFAMELCQFITLDFQEWKHRGHSKKDAWKMMAVYVRWIFKELYSERVAARDAYDQGNPSFTTGKYLWATWKAHSVMAKYLRHQFYEHPLISAVLARHLADNYVKPDNSQGRKIKALKMQLKHWRHLKRCSNPNMMHFVWIGTNMARRRIRFQKQKMEVSPTSSIIPDCPLASALNVVPPAPPEDSGRPSGSMSTMGIRRSTSTYTSCAVVSDSWPG